ncbi:hypothetical protein CAOG_00477 [Capsaspora owczarzaki ATCC 30864]|uniref:Rho-GAP domain-containing protein n=1 Tax=Capsaspora owczarzaki (strain ATCC 30864) TaxID=595528 RepID=A0A0D2U0Y8_CAPO3|nr:hypothetical protein CAOG_00477 [Capsaspora owczarzaki ATCC 30864]KJE88901.1 hypothetical protein CAOG_000477 [Capsaspora owczarzaki ATCC 30864]|eukprot:XP_004365348.1 hypothetical protein CAOG_00477 [Capsaspora owczarzaki ATCC 30864]
MEFALLGSDDEDEASGSLRRTESSERPFSSSATTRRHARAGSAGTHATAIAPTSSVLSASSSGAGAGAGAGAAGAAAAAGLNRRSFPVSQPLAQSSSVASGTSASSSSGLIMSAGPGTGTGTGPGSGSGTASSSGANSSLLAPVSHSATTSPRSSFDLPSSGFQLPTSLAKKLKKHKDKDKDKEKEKEKDKDKDKEKDKDKDKEKDKDKDKETKDEPSSAKEAHPDDGHRNKASKAIERLAAASVLKTKSATLQHAAIRKKDPNKPTKIFEVPLPAVVERSTDPDDEYHLPALCRKCIMYLELTATQQQGIFRLSGSASRIKDLKNSFDKGEDPNLTGESDPNVVAGLLKLFLRELPDPLVDKNLQPLVTEALTNPVIAEKIDEVRALVGTLPFTSYVLLAWLCIHLMHIAEQAELTKMNLPNLAIVFSPTLRISQETCLFLIEHAASLFKDFRRPFTKCLAEARLESIDKIDSIAELRAIQAELMLQQEGLVAVNRSLLVSYEAEKTRQHGLETELQYIRAGEISEDASDAGSSLDSFSDDGEADDIEALEAQLEALSKRADELETSNQSICRELHAERSEAVRLRAILEMQ